jgi:hypothetical protein
MKEITEQVRIVANLAEQLHKALEALTGPSGQMTSWWYGKPADWPENLPWSDEEIARASNAIGALNLDGEGDWE